MLETALSFTDLVANVTWLKSTPATTIALAVKVAMAESCQTSLLEPREELLPLWTWET